jgi:hypothetical protein
VQYLLLLCLLGIILPVVGLIDGLGASLLNGPGRWLINVYEEGRGGNVLFALQYLGQSVGEGLLA